MGAMATGLRAPVLLIAADSGRAASSQPGQQVRTGKAARVRNVVRFQERATKEEAALARRRRLAKTEIIDEQDPDGITVATLAGGCYCLLSRPVTG